MPNRVVADGRDLNNTTLGDNTHRPRIAHVKSNGKDRLRLTSSSNSTNRGRVLRWWDGSHGNVLQVPYRLSYLHPSGLTETSSLKL